MINQFIHILVWSALNSWHLNQYDAYIHHTILLYDLQAYTTHTSSLLNDINLFQQNLIKMTHLPTSSLTLPRSALHFQKHLKKPLMSKYYEQLHVHIRWDLSKYNVTLCLHLKSRHDFSYITKLCNSRTLVHTTITPFNYNISWATWGLFYKRDKKWWREEAYIVPINPARLH